MRNYIELNGQSSAEIKGLLIQSLPPISKPKIRTNIEEIDGRDGDIVTQLGYAAYDKIISVGLYGDYDVDEVIAFFDSAGTVIFSNEPDKYYNYQITDQIDFDRLIRFRTAEVTLHTQPFKFSSEELAKTWDTNQNLLSIPDFTKTTNGITLTVDDGEMTITGTGTAATEFYLPITALNLTTHNYTFSVSASGAGTSSVAVRLIQSVPSDADTFSGTYMSLQDGTTITQSATLSSDTTYNYIWFYISGNPTLNVTATASMVDNTAKSITVQNNGNIYSRPIMTLSGSGTVNLSLNGNQLFVIYFGSEDQEITIDTNAMEAYQGDITTLMNRYVDGDYENFALNVGSNTISWSGDLNSITINKYSRWI